MNHSHIRAFHAVAITGGFTAAAKHLGMSQPSISSCVRSLEKKYQTALFYRQGKFIKLTSSGEQLLRLSEQYFKIEKEARQLLVNMADNQQGAFRLAADQANRLFPHATNFKMLFPNMALEVQVLQTTQLFEELLDFQHDLIISEAHMAHDHLVCQMITKEVLTVTVPLAHPLSTLSQIIPPDLNNYTIFLFDETGTLSQRIYQWLIKYGVRAAQIVYCESRELAIEAVTHGEGVTFLSQKQLATDRRLSYVAFEQCSVFHEEYIIYQRKSMMTRFISGLTQKVAHLPIQEEI